MRKRYNRRSIGKSVDGFMIEEVILSATPELSNKLRTNCICPGQKCVIYEDGSCLFRIIIRVDTEFENALMGMLPDIDIWYPDALREKIKSRMHFKTEGDLPTINVVLEE